MNKEENTEIVKLLQSYAYIFYFDSNKLNFSNTVKQNKIKKTNPPSIQKQ